MKRSMIVLLTIIFLTVATAAAEATAKTTTLRVEGMTCGGCATAVRIVLRKLEGVKTASVSYEEKKAVVTYDLEKIRPQQMAEAIQKKLSYKVTVIAE